MGSMPHLNSNLLPPAFFTMRYFMLKKIATLASVITLIISGTTPANASPRQTGVVAQMTCGNYSKAMILYPEYYGQTRSGLDIWICVETGSARQVFATFDQGPYAVLACNMMQCELIDWTY